MRAYTVLKLFSTDEKVSAGCRISSYLSSVNEVLNCALFFRLVQGRRTRWELDLMSALDLMKLVLFPGQCVIFSKELKKEGKRPQNKVYHLQNLK